MAEKNQVYKCDLCGNIVEVLHGGKGTLVCCEKDMRLLKENTVDAAVEKHVPVVEKTDSGIKVKVGDVAHPMTDDHWIEWIQVITKEGKACRKYLNPGDVPEAEFCISDENASVREYCNLHGLWRT